jgi:hypothetical protein
VPRTKIATVVVGEDKRAKCQFCGAEYAVWENEYGLYWRGKTKCKHWIIEKTGGDPLVLVFMDSEEGG